MAGISFNVGFFSITKCFNFGNRLKKSSLIYSKLVLVIVRPATRLKSVFFEADIFVELHLSFCCCCVKIIEGDDVFLLLVLTSDAPPLLASSVQRLFDLTFTICKRKDFGRSTVWPSMTFPSSFNADR